MWHTPDAPDGVIVGRVLLIPQRFTAAVDGALEYLADTWNWEQFGAYTPDQCAALMRDVIDAYYASKVMTDISGGLMSVPAWDLSSAPNGWAFGADALAFFGGVYQFPNNNQNNEVSWAVRIGEGTWRIDILCTTRSTAGIINWALDGTIVTTSDTYSAALTRNVKIASATFVVAVGGGKTLRAKMQVKNANSSAYGLQLQAIALTQTA